MRQHQIKLHCQQHPILQYLDLSYCGEQLRLRQFLPEQSLNLAEQDVYLLIQGRIQMGCLDYAGKLHICEYIQASQLLNVLACLEKTALQHDYFSLSSGRLLHIPQALFLQQLQHNHLFKQAIFQWLSKRLWHSAQAQRYLVAGRLKQRIAYQLLSLSEQSATKARLIHISQQQFANLLQVSRQTLHSHLRELLQLGFIEWRYHQVKILDVDALQDVARL